MNGSSSITRRGRTPAARLANLLALGALILGVPLTADAQVGRLNNFSASETPEDDFQLSRSSDFGHLRYGAMLTFDYANDPLVYERELGMADTEEYSVVEHAADLTIGLSLGLFDRLVIFAALPITVVQDGASEADLMAVGINTTAAGAGLSDLTLGARARIWGEADDLFAIAGQLTIGFPTSGSSGLRGDNFLNLRPEVLMELRPERARFNFNIGALIRENTEATGNNLAFGHELSFALGVAYPIFEAEDPRTKLELHGQVYGRTEFGSFFSRESTPLESLFGLKFFHRVGAVAGLAAGPGWTRGFGSPDVRLVAMVAYQRPAALSETAAESTDTDGDGIPDEADECVDEPEDIDQFEDENGCPDTDNDQDGILDDADECRDTPETMNEWEDEDGCPDEVPDTDGDGIVDNVDACVDQPEDVDTYEDEDGCPDPDNDGDGVTDDADQCPLEAGVVENRGCPDTDRDGDTVVDRMDNCPDEPGTVENRGCAERQRVVIEGDRLEILEKVFFRTNRDVIQRRSFALLDNVAQVLNAHPEIETVEVQGHTDSRGSHDHNVDLSQRRAQAVVTYLVEHGVAQSRLTARGYGPDRPIVENARSRTEHAQNRRVEFHIPRAVEGVQQVDNTAGADTADR